MYEQRIWSPYHEDALGSHTIFYGTAGMLRIGGSGIYLFGERNAPMELEVPPESPDGAHQHNFLDAIRTDKALHADIEVGHLSSSLCHLGNIVARLGRAIRFEPKSEQILEDNEANLMLSRSYRENHWAVPGEV